MFPETFPDGCRREIGRDWTHLCSYKGRKASFHFLFRGMFVWVCFTFVPDQKLSASSTKEVLHGIWHNVTTPAPLRLVPLLHLEDYSDTLPWEAMGVEWQRLIITTISSSILLHPSPLALYLLPYITQFLWCFGRSSCSWVPIQGAQELLSHGPARITHRSSLPCPSKSPTLTLLSPAPRRIHFLGPSPIKDNYTVVKQQCW